MDDSEERFLDIIKNYSKGLIMIVMLGQLSIKCLYVNKVCLTRQCRNPVV